MPHSHIRWRMLSRPTLDFLISYVQVVPTDPSRKYYVWTFWSPLLACSLFLFMQAKQKLWTIVVCQIIITILGPMSGPESVVVGRETKRALDVWQWRGKLGFVANGRKANCSEWKKNLIGREIKWSFSYQMAKWGRVSCRWRTLNHMRTIAPAAPQYEYWIKSIVVIEDDDCFC